MRKNSAVKIMCVDKPTRSSTSEPFLEERRSIFVMQGIGGYGCFGYHSATKAMVNLIGPNYRKPVKGINKAARAKFGMAVRAYL